MEQLKISELYSDLSKTLAKELLESKTYPWEVLPCISEFIVKLGNTLSIFYHRPDPADYPYHLAALCRDPGADPSCGLPVFPVKGLDRDHSVSQLIGDQDDMGISFQEPGFQVFQIPVFF